jgi:hypothetical protein
MGEPRTMEEIIDSVPYGWEVVLELLERAAVPVGAPERRSFYDGAHGAIGPWVTFAAYALAAWPIDLLEYGTGIGWAWLTDDGKRLLDWLREYGVDDSKWPKEGQDGKFYTPDGPVARDWNQP